MTVRFNSQAKAEFIEAANWYWNGPRGLIHVI